MYDLSINMYTSGDLFVCVYKQSLRSLYLSLSLSLSLSV